MGKRDQRKVELNVELPQLKDVFLLGAGVVQRVRRMLQIVDVLGRKGGPDLFQIAALQKNAEFKDLIDLVPGDADDLVAVPGDIAQDFFVAELDQRLPDRAFC